MLTCAVNIAVFAAFWPRVGGDLLSTAGFKPCWPIRQLDVSCYGRQRRQDCGKNGKVRGTILTDSGTIWLVQGVVVRGGWVGMPGIRLAMRLFKVLAALDGVAEIELKYHRRGELSRGWPGFCIPHAIMAQSRI